MTCINMFHQKVGATLLTELIKALRGGGGILLRYEHFIQDGHKKELDQDLPHKPACLMSSREQAESSSHFDAKDFLADGNSKHNTAF